MPGNPMRYLTHTYTKALTVCQKGNWLKFVYRISFLQQWVDGFACVRLKVLISQNNSTNLCEKGTGNIAIIQLISSVIRKSYYVCQNAKQLLCCLTKRFRRSYFLINFTLFFFACSLPIIRGVSLRCPFWCALLRFTWLLVIGENGSDTKHKKQCENPYRVESQVNFPRFGSVLGNWIFWWIEDRKYNCHHGQWIPYEGAPHGV